MPRRVLLVDDHEIVRMGLRASLERAGGYEVCGEAASVRQALALADLSPGMVILDLVMGGRDGSDAVGEMRRTWPRALILVYSMNPEEIFAERAIRAGANGYQMKTGSFAELHRALEQIQAGVIYRSPRLCQSQAGGPPPGDLARLTERELQVFLRIGEGKTTGEIATELSLSLKTIASHRENVKAKLSISSGPELARRAMGHVLGQER